MSFGLASPRAQEPNRQPTRTHRSQEMIIDDNKMGVLMLSHALDGGETVAAVSTRCPFASGWLLKSCCGDSPIIVDE